MNQNQYYLLETNKLSSDMLMALESLVSGNKMRFHGRSYKALLRRGLVEDDLTVTAQGIEFYESYCELGPSPGAQLAEAKEELNQTIARMDVASPCYACGRPAVSPHDSQEHNLEMLGEQATDADLAAVINYWPKLPEEFRRLITDAASRISGE